MPEPNVNDSEATQAEELLTTARERLKQQPLADPSVGANNGTIAKVEESTRLFKEGLNHLRQPNLVEKVTFVHKVHEIANCSDWSGMTEEMNIDEVHEKHGLLNHKKATAIEEPVSEVQTLDCDRLENMNLVFWQEKRLGQRATEAALDLKSVERLEYLSLIHLDLAYLQQQRRAEQQVAMAPTQNDCGDDFPATVDLEELRRITHYSSADQSFFQSGDFETTDRVNSLSSESQIHRNSRDLGTLSNEIDSFTSYYYVRSREGPSEIDGANKKAGTPPGTQALAPSQPQHLIDPVYVTKYTDEQASKGSLNKATATISSPSQNAAKAMTPNIGSLETSVTARAATKFVSPTTAGQTPTPKVQGSQVKSGTPDPTISTAKVTLAKSTTPNFKNRQGKSKWTTVTPTRYVQGSHVQSKPTTLAKVAAPKPLSSCTQPEWSSPAQPATQQSQGLRVESAPKTPIQSATPMPLGLCDKSKSTAFTKIASPNTLKKHGIPNTSPNKTQNIQSERKTNKKSLSPRKKQNRPSIPKLWTEENLTKNTRQEISDVPSIDTTERRKQRTTALRNDDKTQMPEGETNLKLDGTSKPAEAGSRDAQEGTVSTTQTTIPPKTLSKSARKKANQKQKKAMQEERERKEAGEIEAAIASSREESAKLRRKRVDPLLQAALADIIWHEGQNNLAAAYRAKEDDFPLARSLKEVPPEELVPRAVEYFLINLHQSLLPESRFRPKQLPLSRTHLLALLRKGYAFFDHIDTDLPPPPVEAINHFVDQFLPLVKQIVPELVDVYRTDAFTRHNTETLLLGSLDALSTFVREDFPPNLQGQEPESPYPNSRLQRYKSTTKAKAIRSLEDQRLSSLPPVILP